jgi:hypothetical protein
LAAFSVGGLASVGELRTTLGTLRNEQRIIAQYGIAFD